MAAEEEDIPFETGEPLCPVCGAELSWRDCDECEALGWVDDDGGWGALPDIVTCKACNGNGGFYRCIEGPQHVGEE